MSLELVQPKPASEKSLPEAVAQAQQLLLSQQYPEGYWSYTLEANESIGAGFIQLMHFIGEVDEDTQRGLTARMLSLQQEDGSWPLFHEGPGDLSTTVECYLALRLSGLSEFHEKLRRARAFILSRGGLTKIRVFTRIHLALFGLVPWSSCPSMPAALMLLPPWSGFSIYEFSSWARACIVPLLLLGEKKPVREIPFAIEELYAEPPSERHFSFPNRSGFFSLSNLFIHLDRLLKWVERLPWHPGKDFAIRMAENWTRDHIERTEDIYPAMGYAILGLKALGCPNSDPTIQKALQGLKRFQQTNSTQTHQQCCISPHWDTPWACLALLEAGLPPDDPRLAKAARYLISKEIRDFRGDWKIKNPEGPSGGWSFEFQNDYFPDLDDALVAINFLRKMHLPPSETSGPIVRALNWILSMQSRNGGWAAFDKDNLASWVNKIPFSDHGACLDPPTPDITGRMIEMLASFGYMRDHPVIARAVRFLQQSQEPFGAWRGRWAVNFIHGTWCVLQGFQAIGRESREAFLQKAVGWLKSIQNRDGGWGESCRSDEENRYVPLDVSTASQTAWAVLGLMAAGEADSPSARRGIQWLIQNQRPDGGWDEPYYTGTGFPGHFYIRYHGYRHYFPLLALGRYQNYHS